MNKSKIKIFVLVLISLSQFSGCTSEVNVSDRELYDSVEKTKLQITSVTQLNQELNQKNLDLELQNIQLRMQNQQYEINISYIRKEKEELEETLALHGLTEASNEYNEE